MMQVMLPLWLLALITIVIASSQVVALLLLGRFIRLADRQTLSASKAFQAHLERIESQSRISSERFRVIQASLDVLTERLSVRQPPLLLPYAPPSPSKSEPEVRASSNSVPAPERPTVSSWRELTNLVKESEA